MNTKEQIIEYMRTHEGTITTQELNGLGIHRQYLKELLESNLIEKMSRGLYQLPNTFDDYMYALQQRFKKGIYSHGTALYLHDLTDRTPLKYTMTFPEPYNTTEAKRSGLLVYRSFEKYYSENTVSLQTANGNWVQVYDKEKTLCDIVRGNSKLTQEEVVNAFKAYAKTKSKNVSKLMDLAKKHRVYKKVKDKMEMLL